MKQRARLLKSLLSILILSVCCMTFVSLSAGAEKSSVLSVPEKAFIGDTVSIPEEVTVDGAKLKVSAEVLTPDKSAFTGSEITLETPGLYQFDYKANGKTVKTEYCMCIRRPQDFFETNSFAEVQGVTEYSLNPSYKGLKFKAEKGAAFSFTRTVDLSNATNDDLLFNLLVDPTVSGQADFSVYTITLTDVYNEDNFITITVTDSTMVNCNGQASYVRAGGSDQIAGGWAYSGNNYVFDTRSIYGTPLYSGFRGIENGECLSLKLYYDNAERALYGYRGFDYRMNGKTLIADLDDPSVFGSNIWEGFTDGKVKVSFAFDGFMNESANFMILNCCGFDLSSDGYEDSAAPEIEIDLCGEDKAPDSVVGYTYKIFGASAKDDLDETVTVNTRVEYTNPADSKTVNVAITDNSFVTSRNGIYTIIYSAIDLSGNKSEKTLSFFCTGQERGITVETASPELSVTLYDKVAIGGINSVRASGGYGNLTVKRLLTDSDGKEVSVANDTFTPEKLGKYLLEYTAYDFFGNCGKQSFQIEVNALQIPVFINDVVLPSVLIEGFTYKIPEVFAKECVNGVIKDVNVETYVNGIKKTGTFQAPSGSLAEIVYKAKGISGSANDRSYSIAVVNGNSGKNQAEYFYSVNAAVSEEQARIALQTDKDSEITFANTLNGNAFSLGMSYESGKTNFGSFRVVLSEVENPEIKVTFRFFIEDGKVYVTTPDGAKASLSVKANDFSFKYSNSDCIISDINNIKTGLVRYDDNGNEFSGFSGSLNFRIYFDGVSGESLLYLTELNNQKLGYRTSSADGAQDETSPEIVIGGEYVYKQTQHKTLTIFAASAYDVLSEITQFTVKVTAPDGKVVLNDLDATKTYQAELTQLGIYRIVYTAIDSNGNKALAGATVNAYDSVSPTLSVDTSSIKNVYRVGSVVALPTATVSDDTASVYYDVFLQTPDNEVRLLIHSEGGTVKSFISSYGGSSFAAGDNSFRLTQSGRYILTYFAYDGNYNYVAVTIEIFAV